jgi:hypothetical protein
MGGFGSGDYFRWNARKSTVEESLVLAMREFRGRLYPHVAGTFTWTWTSGSKSSVGWFVTLGDGRWERHGRMPGRTRADRRGSFGWSSRFPCPPEVPRNLTVSYLVGPLAD